MQYVQHGLRPRHSGLNQLLETIHEWAATLDRAVQCLDFAKEFDSVPHQKLLIKLNHIGVRGQVFKMDYITWKNAGVVVNGCFCLWTPVTSGVPQGSVLGPLLFIIYINDIMDEVSSTGGLFADDRIIYREVSHRRDAEELERDLEKISN